LIPKVAGFCHIPAASDMKKQFNLNIGHAMPRCIIPFGVDAAVDAERQIIRFTE